MIHHEGTKKRLKDLEPLIDTNYLKGKSFKNFPAKAPRRRGKQGGKELQREKQKKAVIFKNLEPRIHTNPSMLPDRWALFTERYKKFPAKAQRREGQGEKQGKSKKLGIQSKFP